MNGILLWSTFSLDILPFSVSKPHKILKLSCAEYERSQKMTIFEFISNIGGLCGLCLGISFVSAIEVFYWFCVRFCRNLILSPGGILD